MARYRLLHHAAVSFVSSDICVFLSMRGARMGKVRDRFVDRPLRSCPRTCGPSSPRAARSRRPLAPPAPPALSALLSLPNYLSLFTGKRRAPPHAERVEKCLRAGPSRGDKQVRPPKRSLGGNPPLPPMSLLLVCAHTDILVSLPHTDIPVSLGAKALRALDSGGAQAGGDGEAECERSSSAYCCSPLVRPWPSVPARSLRERAKEGKGVGIGRRLCLRWRRNTCAPRLVVGLYRLFPFLRVFPLCA